MFLMASTKHWHKPVFDRIVERSKTEGIFVSTHEELLQAVSEKNFSWVFFPHWSSIIPKEICEKINGVIFHSTPLPYGRGGSPIQNMIAADHTITKLSAIRLEETLDSGNILTQDDIPLTGTAEEIFLRSCYTIEEQCLRILSNQFTEHPQVGTPTYFKRRKPSDSNVSEQNFTSLLKIHDFIRMLDCENYPKAFLVNNNLRIEFSRSSLKNGKVIADAEITLN